MRQVWSKVSSCRRSAADCSCGILVCGKSAAKFNPAADLPQTVPVAYWYAASLQQNFFLPHTSAYSLPQTKSLRQVCGILFTFLWGSWVKLFSVMSSGWAWNERESALMKNGLNALPHLPCFLTSFWFVIQFCDSSFKKKLFERNLNVILPQPVRLWFLSQRH